MQSKSCNSHLTTELKDAIRHMVANISKSFIVEWYTSISPTNHDFVASCESLIEEVLLKLAELCIIRLDKYKIGQLVTTLLHDHILNESSNERRLSIEEQIDNFEYDICQNLVVRLFGLLSNDSLRRVVFTLIDDTTTKLYNDLNQVSRHDINDRYNKHYHEQQHHQQAKFSQRAPNGNPKSFSFDDIINSAYPMSSTSTSGTPTKQAPSSRKHSVTKTTSALYTLVIAMLTKAAFMPIVSNISEPKWLYAVIIWLCKKEERERAAREEASKPQATAAPTGAAGSQAQQAKTTGASNHHHTHHQLNKQFNKNNIASATSIIVTNAKVSRTLDLEEGFDIASANINFENPVCDSLKRPLDNIEIFSTEEVKSHSSCYVLYCIRYDGLCYKHASGSFNIRHDYPDVPLIDKRQTHSVRRGRNESSNQRSANNGLAATSSLSYTSQQQQADMSNRKSFRRSMTIKRRFREFVLLQLRLEENPKIRPYLKSIPKPTKLKAATQNIFSLPGINNIKLDQATIKLRQRFLERFLIALNNSPFIANSYEFKEFFSYNVNPACGMSKSKSTILQVNLNKVFVDSVRSAYSIIRSTLPGDDRQSLNTSCSKSDPDAWLTELQQSTLKLHVQTRTSHSKMNLERYIDAKMLSLNDGSPTRSSKSSSLSRGQYQNRGNEGGAFEWMGGGASRGGSLRANMLAKSNSLSSNTNTNSSPIGMSRSSSTYNSNSQLKDSNSQSKSSSTESIYHDASTDPSPANGGDPIGEQSSTNNTCKSIQICDSFPIASKFIDIIYYSISRNSSCSKSPFNVIARLLLGRSIERYAIQLIEATLTLENAAFSINGITSSIWDESDDPPLDMENSSLDEAVDHLTKLIGRNYASHTFVPKQLLTTLIRSQLSFYLEQLSSQKRNKFVIYSFFVHLLDELEIVDN